MFEINFIKFEHIFAAAYLELTSKMSLGRNLMFVHCGFITSFPVKKMNPQKFNEMISPK